MSKQIDYDKQLKKILQKFADAGGRMMGFPLKDYYVKIIVEEKK